MTTRGDEEILLRKPAASDGYAIHQLIANSPPLDLNSTYSYYLLADHFHDSCVIAGHRGHVVGFLSAYPLPSRPQTLFVWQVVVSHALRGRGIAWRMLESLLQRPEMAQMECVETTVNPSNRASRGLFQRLATHHGAAIEEQTYLEASAFGPGGEHESEILLRVPLKQTN